jgi:hypothetical protein
MSATEVVSAWMVVVRGAFEVFMMCSLLPV